MRSCYADVQLELFSSGRSATTMGRLRYLPCLHSTAKIDRFVLRHRQEDNGNPDSSHEDSMSPVDQEKDSSLSEFPQQTTSPFSFKKDPSYKIKLFQKGRAHTEYTTTLVIARNIGLRRDNCACLSSVYECARMQDAS